MQWGEGDGAGQAGSKLSVPRRWGVDPERRVDGGRGRDKGGKGKKEKKNEGAERRPREEGRLSDLFSWQDDKTARNATERGKRSDQELKARGAGVGVRGGRRQTGGRRAGLLNERNSPIVLCFTKIQTTRDSLVEL